MVRSFVLILALCFGLVESVHLASGSSATIYAADRCQATTKKGTQCKRDAQPGAKYCWQHTPREQAQPGQASQAASVQCQAKTKRGSQCSRKAKAGSKFCWQHGGA